MSEDDGSMTRQVLRSIALIGGGTTLALALLGGSAWLVGRASTARDAALAEPATPAPSPSSTPPSGERNASTPSPTPRQI